MRSRMTVRGEAATRCEVATRGDAAAMGEVAATRDEVETRGEMAGRDEAAANDGGSSSNRCRSPPSRTAPRGRWQGCPDMPRPMAWQNNKETTDGPDNGGSCGPCRVGLCPN